jgi:2,3-bisphosphoglycerate-dependent phosphoglycerate mutase
MKLKFSFKLLIAFVMVCFLACQQPPSSINTKAAVTTVYIVRHGEKDLTDPENKDPDLNIEGKARAEELQRLLKDQQVDALYSTNYKRTIDTVKPLAEERKLEIVIYEPNSFEELKNQVLNNHAGKTVVITGHSNTILNIVQAFGVEKPFEEIPDSKYDHLFKITLTTNKPAVLEAGRYGKVTD